MNTINIDSKGLPEIKEIKSVEMDNGISSFSQLQASHSRYKIGDNWEDRDNGSIDLAI